MDRELDEVSFTGCVFLIFPPFGVTACLHQPGGDVARILCGRKEPHITTSFQAVGVVNGARNLSKFSKRSRRSLKADTQ